MPVIVTFLGRIAVITRCGPLLQTEYRGLSVCLCVVSFGHVYEPCKTAKPIKMPIGG